MNTVTPAKDVETSTLSKNFLEVFDGMIGKRNCIAEYNSLTKEWDCKNSTETRLEYEVIFFKTKNYSREVLSSVEQIKRHIQNRIKQHIEGDELSIAVFKDGAWVDSITNEVL